MVNNYYLKISCKEEGYNVMPIHDHPKAGHLDEIMRGRGYAVLQFQPNCNEGYNLPSDVPPYRYLGFRSSAAPYDTEKDALRAAIGYLDQEGYNVKLFDLEGMLETI
jgi:hypothetical protein